ncbi:SpoIVB peptidase, partial [Ferroacidibacillus organovorans]
MKQMIRMLSILLCATLFMMGSAPQATHAASGWTWAPHFWSHASAAPSSYYAVPGGQSIGIKLHAQGVLVVGYHFIHQGKVSLSPAQRAHVRIGDMITSIDGQPVNAIEQVTQCVNNAAALHRTATFHVIRQKAPLAIHVKPEFDDDSGGYRIGLFIRDTASGVGTLSFYLPKTNQFGALGHVITDVDTGEPILGRGQIVHASVTSIERGESGQPGEKRGSFVNDHRVLGTIEDNHEFGVFGRLMSPPGDTVLNKPIEVARLEQVHAGPAQLLTVISGQRVESFRVMVVRTLRQDHPESKGLVIKVVDPVLLAKTGGIVQGMSGSPLLQDGR